MHAFRQVDVFTNAGNEPWRGNPVAVVHDAAGLADAQLARFAHWTNLSETTFLLPPTSPEADYRLRIFTPDEELPFAGHPTLGSAAAWLDAGGVPAAGDRIVQECGVGLVTLRREGDRLAFAAPPLIRSGPVEPETAARVRRALRLDELIGPEAAARAPIEWLVNGPRWIGVLLPDADSVLAASPDWAAFGDLEVGLVGEHADPAAVGADVEVRAFCPGLGVVEDPVTGSLNAGLAQWLIGSGRLPASYVARQGTALGRDGRVHVHHDGTDVWVGGRTAIRITGTVDFGDPGDGIGPDTA